MSVNPSQSEKAQTIQRTNHDTRELRARENEWEQFRRSVKVRSGFDQRKTEAIIIMAAERPKGASSNIIRI